jgi:hypothetical protein
MSRKRVSCILGGVSVALVFAGCVEGLDGSVTLWNFISLFGTFVCGWFSKWLDDHSEVSK